MKRFLILSLICIFVASSSVYADFNSSLRRANTFNILEDDWDAIVNPMYYSLLKGNNITAGLDNNYFGGNALYMGTGLGLFGFKETLALRFTDNTAENLDIDTTVRSDKNFPVAGKTNLKTDKTEDTADVQNGTGMDLYVGFGLPMGDNTIGIGILINSVNNDTEKDWKDEGSNNTNGALNSYDITQEQSSIDKESDSKIGVLLGGTFGKISGQIGFNMITKKDTGSEYEDIQTTKRVDGSIQRKQVTTRKGDWNEVTTSFMGNFDTDAVAKSGTGLGARIEVALSEMLNPGIAFGIESLDLDESEISEVQEDSQYNLLNRLIQYDKTTSMVNYENGSDSSMNINVFNHMIFKVSDDVTAGGAIDYALGTTKNDYSVTVTRTEVAQQDNNADGDFTDAGDVNTIDDFSGQKNTYLKESTSHTISIPLFVEIGVAKGFALRIASRISYILESTDTEEVYVNDPTLQKRTDLNNPSIPALNWSVKLPNVSSTETKNVDNASRSRTQKTLYFGAGWDVNEKLSIDMLSSTTVNAFDIYSFNLSGTYRF